MVTNDVNPQLMSEALPDLKNRNTSNSVILKSKDTHSVRLKVATVILTAVLTQEIMNLSCT